MSNNEVKPQKLVLRCYAEKKGNQWQAFCLEFDLAVQSDSFASAKKKLEQQIKSYVYDALVGEDKEFAYQLLNRKAPLSMYARFHLGHFLHVISKLFKKNDSTHKQFCEPLPLIPA